MKNKTLIKKEYVEPPRCPICDWAINGDIESQQCNGCGWRKNSNSQVMDYLQQWDFMCKYTHITDVKEYGLFDLVQLESRCVDTVAIDTETTGLSVVSDKILGYSFSFKESVAYWVDIEDDPDLWLLKRVMKNKTVVMANAGYDLGMLEGHGIDVENIKAVDVLICAFFADIERYKFNAGLKDQAKTQLHLATVELKEIIAYNMGVDKIKKEDIDFRKLTPWQKRIYGSQDADITLRLWRKKSFQDAIKRMPGIWELETNVIRTVMKMHRNGVLIKESECNALDGILSGMCEDLEKKATKIALEECETEKDKYGNVVFTNKDLQKLTVKYYKTKAPKYMNLNIGSASQRKILLFDELKLPKTRQTKTGFSTKSDELEQIAHEHKIIPMLMQFNKLKSKRSNFTKKMPGLINPVSGRVHCSLWQTGARSGRFSTSNPNLQGTGKDDEAETSVRRLIVAEKGNELTASDYSQIELRVGASLSLEPLWQKAYRSDNADLHMEMARKIFGVKNPTDKQRQSSKIGNFSAFYGVTAYSFSQKNNMEFKEGQEFLELWWNAVQVLKQWTNRIKDMARMNKQAVTHFGRIRPLEEINEPNQNSILAKMSVFKNYDWAKKYDDDKLYDMARNSIMRGILNQAVSHVVSGTSADIMKMTLVRVHNGIKKYRLPIQMLLTIHDEILFEHPLGMRDEVSDFIKEHMEYKADDPRLTTPNTSWVPLPVDIGHGASWADCH